MAVSFYLTDEDAAIAGYKRARLGERPDTPSLVRAVTATEAGPSDGIQITRTSSGTALAWITDPLDGTDLTVAAWALHLWAKESAAAANAALRFQVFKFDTAEAGSALLDDNQGTELSTTMQDVAITTGNATVTALADGDRLVFKFLVDDAGTMAADHTVTFAYNGEYPRAEGDSYVTCPDTLAVTAAMPTATRVRARRLLHASVSASDYTVQLSEAEVDQAFGNALREYSQDRPRLAVGALSGDGSTSQFPLPRFWVRGLSSIREVEHPTGNYPRTLVEPGDYEVLESILGVQPTRLLTFIAAPDSGTDNVLVRYTTRHVHTDELDTIPPDDFDAVCWLAASYGALQLAAKMAGSSDPTIGADSVHFRDGEMRYRSVAKAYRERYDQHVKGDAEVAAASVTADWDSNFSFGADRIFHPRRWR